MHPNKRTRCLVVWGAALVAWANAGGQCAVGQAPAPDPREVMAPKVDRTGALIVPLQGSVRLQMKTKALIRDVFNSTDSAVSVEADPIDPASVIVFGRQVGTSRVTLTDVNGQSETYMVVVQPDIELLRQTLRQAEPTAGLEVLPVGANSVLVRGYVATAESADRVIRIAAQFVGGEANVINALTVGGVHQVQLDVVVAQVSRSEARARGFSFGFQGTEVFGYSILGGLAIPTGSTFPPSSGGLSPTATPNVIFGVVPASFGGFLQALRTEGLAKTLAEPKLVTLSGRPARFLAGGRQAVLSPGSGINGPGVVFEDIGTELSFLPVVYGDGRIYLEVSPTIRNVNPANGITTSFGVVPGFDEQSVRTSVVMEDGQTFAIGGLIQSQVQASASKVPVLGDIPFLGAAFSTISETETEQELVILVTVHLVDPMDCSQLCKHLPGRETRSASDFELFLEGLIEAPRGQRQVFEDHKYKAAWKNHPTAVQYPCGLNVLPGHGGIHHGGIHHGGMIPAGGCDPLNPGVGCENGACPGAMPGATPGTTGVPPTIPYATEGTGPIEPAPQTLPQVSPTEPTPPDLPDGLSLDGPSDPLSVGLPVMYEPGR